MAEISCGGHVESAALEGDWRPWCDDCHYAARDRLAEVEAERESLQRQWQRDHDEMSARRKNAEARLAAALRRAEAAEARLAEVIGLCDEARSGAFDSRASFESAVRAAARGEGDRPAALCADCGHARDKHPVGLARFVIYCQGAPSSAEMCRCKRYSGEGDRPAAFLPECAHGNRGHCPSCGEGDRTAAPWPDEDGARFLAHERAQRSGEGDRG